MTAIATQNGDIYLDGANNLVLIGGIQRVLQQCAQVMQLQLGEAIYATQRGVPYFSSVFDRYQADRFEAAARTNLLTVSGVTSIISFSATVRGSTLFYEARILTEFGEGRISG